MGGGKERERERELKKYQKHYLQFSVCMGPTPMKDLARFEKWCVLLVGSGDVLGVAVN